MFQTSDQTLIHRALGGSEKSWVKLVKRHEKRVYNYCLRMSGNEADALDLMQEIFLSIFRHLPSWRGTGEFSHWMMRIASSKVIDMYRLKSRHPLDSEETDQIYDSTSSGENYAPAIKAEQEETNQLILKAMQALQPEHRLLLELRFFQQMTFSEISEQTGMPLNTVKTRFYTSLARLRNNQEVRHAL